MKVAVIGANGQLGADVCEQFEGAGHEVLPLTHAQIEIADLDSVSGVLGPARPDLLVNTAAMHHVERCEENPGRAYEINAIGARNLACYSADSGASLMHVSTDYVFDGVRREPYRETDAAAPLNVYGSTKLAGELFVRSTTERHFILRTSGLFGKNVCRDKGPNFVDKMLELSRTRESLRVVDDEVLTPTSTLELARQMVRLAGTDRYGLIHATAEGGCSWYAFTAEIFRLAGVNTRLEVAAPGEFPAKVPRPSYSVLANHRLAEAGINVFRPWQDGLREYLGVG